MRRGLGRATSLLLLLVACPGGEGETPPPEAQSPGTTDPAVTEATWQRLAPIPTPRTEVTAAAVGEEIYVIGGFDAGGDTVSTVEVYDAASDQWSGGPDLPIPVNHAMSAVAHGTLYVMGGYLSGLGDPTDRVFALRDGRWEELPRMPAPRAASGAAAVGDEVYVAGGVGPGGLADTMLVLDTEEGRWRTGAGLLVPREHLGVASFDGRVYAVGGRTGGIGTNLGESEVFDPATGNWTPLPPMPTPRGGLAAAATSDGLVVAPGGEAEATFHEVEALDAEAHRWVVLPPMPSPRHGLGVAAVGTTVYVVAGGPQPGLSVTDATEALDVADLPS